VTSPAARNAVAAALVIASLPLGLSAQVTAATLVSKMETIAAYPLWRLDKSRSDVLGLGYGLEISFGIGDWTRKMTEAEREANCKDIIADGGKCDPAVTFTASAQPIQIRSSNGIKDTTFSYKQTPLTVTKVSFSVTVANKVTDVLKDNVVPGWQMHGKIHEWPTFTIHGTIRPDWTFSPYLGATFTQGALSNVKISKADTAATVDATTIGGAGSVGVVVQVLKFNIFTEVEYAKLSFNTTQWKRPPGLAGATLPERIKMDGWRASLGILFSLKQD
jgi:outer membrane protein W